jgi:hypothetical protein
MTGRRERSKVMKRSVIALGIGAALLVAPSVANAASVPQVRSQVVDSQLTRSEQLLRPQLVRRQVARQQIVRQVVRPGLVRSERVSALRISEHLLQLR